MLLNGVWNGTCCLTLAEKCIVKNSINPLEFLHAVNNSPCHTHNLKWTSMSISVLVLYKASLKWRNRINNVCVSAHKLGLTTVEKQARPPPPTLCVGLKVFTHIVIFSIADSIHLMKLPHKSLLRLKVQYCNVVWGPYSKRSTELGSEVYLR